MLIGRLQDGRPIVAYENADEIIDARSCMACIFYNDVLPCRFYGDCRVGRQEGEEPRMFRFAGRQHMEKYMTEVGDNNGYKLMHIHG
jgi:hypothetical protein